MFLTEDELNNLSTKRLLAYKNKHFTVYKEEGHDSIERWLEIREIILTILKDRPHVERGERYVKGRVRGKRKDFFL